MGGILQVDTIQNNNTSNLITQTNVTTITIGTSGQTVALNTLKFPTADGTAGQVLQTNGSEVLSFELVTPNSISTDNAQLRFMAATTSATTLTAQNIFYKTTWNQQLIDNFNEFDPTTNYRFTASEAGTYLFNCSCSFRLSNDQNLATLAYYKNGSASSSTDVYKIIMGSNEAEGYFTTAYKVTLVATDYIEIFAQYSNSVGVNRQFNDSATGGEAVWTGWKIA
jgi:hypothetical protein